MPLATPPVPVRVLFLDVLRLLAAVQMVQGHTLDALLAPAYRQGPWFSAWTFARGLTSTMFLVAAGLSFALVTGRAAASGTGRRRRVRRAFMLVAIGYAMHAPIAISFGTPPREALREALSVDVLQCIGVSLLVLEGVQAAFTSLRARVLSTTALGALCIALTRPFDALIPHGAWFPLTSYLSARSGSLFPLFPWMAYVLLGFAAGQLVFFWSSWRMSRSLLALALLLLLAAGLLTLLGPYGDPRTAPDFVLLKLALVLALASLLAAVLARTERLPARLTELSGETLFLYVSHVVVLYAGHVGLKARLGATETPAMALSVSAALLVACSAGALSIRHVPRILRGWRSKGTRPA